MGSVAAVALGQAPDEAVERKPVADETEHERDTVRDDDRGHVARLAEQEGTAGEGDQQRTQT
ncbi:MAG: hypothetical protein ACRDZ4_01415 [Egibacteraceae bacterium]